MEHCVLVQENSYFGTVLYFATQSGNFESMEAILALYPESEGLWALSATDRLCLSVLLLRAALGVSKLFFLFIRSTQALNMKDKRGNCRNETVGTHFLNQIVSGICDELFTCFIHRKIGRIA